jgi:hypothetical protein
MRKILLITLLLSACFRKDPLYCDDATPCGMGLVCLMPQRECVSATADLPPAADLRAPDLGEPDLVTPPECTTGAQCPAARPACSAGRCQPCRRNYECPDAACDDGGACHDKARVLVVDDTAGACRRTGEPAGKPYCYLAEALKDAEAGKTKDVILLRPSTRGGHRLDGSFLEVRAGVRIVGARADRAAAPVSVREPFEIRAGVDVPVGLEDIAIRDFDSGIVSGVYCGEGTRLTVRWSRIEGARNNGLISEGCVVRLLSDQILRNATERTTTASGVYISGGELTMDNTIVAENGEGNLQGGGVFLFEPRRTTITLSTLTANRCSIAALGCNLACPVVNRADVSYSIVAGTAAGRASLSGSCQVMNSVVPMGFMGGSGNLAGFTPVFANPAQADYHLSPSDPTNSMLRRTEPNPPLSFDVDDDARPAGAVDIGADQRP